MGDGEVTDYPMQRFELQKSLFEKGFEQIQKQIIHIDEILFKIKASAITVWVALMGWAFTSSESQIVPLGIVAIIGFWLLEAIFKGVQIRYIEISSKLMHVVNDTALLQKQIEAKNFEGDVIYPVSLNLKEIDRLILMGRGIISPTIATVYIFLGFANVLVWMVLIN